MVNEAKLADHLLTTYSEDELINIGRHRLTVAQIADEPLYRRSLWRRCYGDAVPSEGVLGATGHRNDTGRKRCTSFVYFIGSDDGPVKIGLSSNVERRFATLQVASPVKLKVLATIDGDAALERAYHQKFSAHRLNGEWFKPVGPIMREIRRLSKG